MKKVVLVGMIGNHHSLYDYILSILVNHFDCVSFITQSKINKEINISNKNIKLIIDDRPVYEVLKNKLDLINNHDILVLDEYFERYYRLVGLKFNSKKRILIVHNVNKWNKILTNPFVNIKSFFDQFFRKNFTKQIDAFITLGPNIQKYFLSLNPKKPVFFLPFVFSNNFQSINESIGNEINLLIPGMISNERRNYKDLLDFFESYLSINLNSRIRLVFLGKIFSKEDRFIANQSDNINLIYGERIKYWNSFIDQKDFDKEVMKSNFILSNIYPEQTVNGIIEKYGISKGTGISYVFYQNTKPGIIPSFQNVLEGFDSQFIKFDNYSDLLDVFKRLDNNEYNLFELRHNSIKNSRKFNKTIIKEREKFIQYILNK